MMPVTRHFMAMLSGPLLVAVFLAATRTATACGLEPTIKGGFTVSHPGSIEVAVAVAKARRDGFLSPANTKPISNVIVLQRMLADLQQLRTRLANGRGATKSFSLVLVGPGLWSHFRASGGSILGQYHVSGPLADKATVLTHHAVLKALLSGNLSIHQAMELGLITYSGESTDAIRGAFESGFESNRQNTWFDG